MAAPTVTYQFVSGQNTDAGQMNTNFSDLVNATSDGTKDFTIANISVNGSMVVSGTFTANGTTTTIGNASSDTLTINAAIASNLLPTDATYDLGSTANKWNRLYLASAISTTSTPDVNALYANTIPKAWGLVGSAGTLIAGVGIGSVSRSAAGTYRYTLLRSMADSNYAVIATTRDGSGQGSTIDAKPDTASSFSVFTSVATTVVSAQDHVHNVIVFGNQ